MAFALLFALQAAAAPAPIDFDLGRAPRAAPDARSRREACADRPDTIVVCGTRPRGGDYPMDEMARRYEERPMVAETGIGGGASARAFLDQQEIAPGLVSQRLMVGLRLVF